MSQPIALNRPEARPRSRLLLSTWLGSLLLVAAGCGTSMSAPVTMRNPQTGETATCGAPYGRESSYRLIRDCIEGYQRQGWERVRN
jgi:hypothetical protein